MAARFSGRGAEDRFQLLARPVVVADLDQRAAERDAGGQIRRVPLQAAAAGLYGFFVAALTAVLLRQRRKRNRRRIHLDPASQLLYARILRHPPILRPTAASSSDVDVFV